MSERPKPSQINTGLSDATPFIGCFGKFEKEVAAAIYVETCKECGDAWIPISPRSFGLMLEALAIGGKHDLSAARPILTKPPTWITALQFGHVPDMLGLVKDGFFTMAEDKSVEPTDKFFSTLAQKEYVIP